MAGLCPQKGGSRTTTNHLVSHRKVETLAVPRPGELRITKALASPSRRARAALLHQIKGFHAIFHRWVTHPQRARRDYLQPQQATARCSSDVSHLPGMNPPCLIPLTARCCQQPQGHPRTCCWQPVMTSGQNAAQRQGQAPGSAPSTFIAPPGSTATSVPGFHSAMKQGF